MINPPKTKSEEVIVAVIGIVFQSPIGARSFREFKTLSGAQGSLWRTVGMTPPVCSKHTGFGDWSVEATDGNRAEIRGSTYEELFPAPGSKVEVVAQHAVTTTRRTSQKIKDFPGCQLAEEFDPKVKFELLLAEPKMDGYRLCAVVRGGEVKFCTRTGLDEPYTTNLEHIAVQLLELGFRNCMIDGEVTAKGFNDVAIIRHINPDEATKKRLREEVMFHVFDWVDLSAIENQLIGRKMRDVFPLTQSQRRAFIEKALGGEKLANVRITPQFMVRSAAEVAELTEEMLELGFEGLMLKRPDAPYVFDRTTNWLKVKPTKTIDLQITAVVEGEGRLVGTMGAIHGKHESGEIYSAGTGYTDKVRAEIWAKRAEIIGTWMEIKVQLGDVSEARHPVFIRFREDRNE